MSDYYVIKREKCETCKGNGNVQLTNEPHCMSCQGLGYTATQTDLLDVLAKVRWREPGSGFGESKERAFDCLRLKDE